MITTNEKKHTKLSWLLLAGVMGVGLNSLATPDVDPTSDPASQPQTETKLDGYKLTWSDEFSGFEVDEAKWEYRLDSKHWSTQMARNNVVADGVASILLKKENVAGMEYTGGGIISRKYFRYGYYEARIRCPEGAGWHTSFWMMDNHHTHNHTSQVELDPLENDSIDLHKFSTDYHQWRSDIGHMKRYQLVKPKNPLNEWHVYGMEWTPEAAYFYFDGKLVRTAKDLTQQLPKADKAAGKKPIVRKVSDTDKNDLQIWFTSIATWLGGTEKVDESVLPSSAQCDYVRFFSKGDPEPVLAKGSSTKEMYMSNQKANAEKQGKPFDSEKAEKIFEQLDADGDGIATSEEKKAYWGN